ncbi:DUF3631 domain-containing protein [Chitinibacter bivalviorum]|uniref:DUF3631 domain-containing protein n=1 Tax=Chitinibacter bivalviorum TaxID=2739434 RepID=A0A7H9BIY7_9NEIS|nr:DUF3631 domain-containing protein [Chitinibacter bivalviorum]QLG88615.1 DUF3631 domain-containing protein [Chitinibacter bivalviorum]
MNAPQPINQQSEIAAALSYVPSHDRDTWVLMAMAVKSELGEAGFDVWDSWSATAENYQSKAAKAVWKSIGAAGKVTIASLFSTAIQNGWKPSKPYTPPTPEQRQQIEAERQAAQAEADALAAQQRAEASAKAKQRWEEASTINAAHPYLIAKGIKPIGAKQFYKMLVLPLRANGEIVNLQYISEDGTKRFGTGGQVKGTSLVLGKLQGAAEALLCEGWATGCTLHEATGLPVVVAWNAGNLAMIAARLSEALPEMALRVCGDTDASGTGQKTASEAAIVHGMAVWCVPVFTPELIEQHTAQHGKVPSDFNDLHQLVGLDAVRIQLTNTITHGEKVEGRVQPKSVSLPENEENNISQNVSENDSTLLYSESNSSEVEILSSTPLQPNNHAGFEVEERHLSTGNENLSSTCKPNNGAGCRGVEDKHPFLGGIAETHANEGEKSPKTEDFDEEAYILHLANLKPLAYERVRQAASEALQTRASVLDKLVNGARRELAAQQDDDNSGVSILFDDVEPWPVPVSGAAVLDDAFALMCRYVIADKETIRAATLWTALTWFVEYATVMPLALITAPEKNCGKSTLLNVLAKLSSRPIWASNITPAALFRAVEKWKPSLFIDEADTFMRDSPELVGIINSGHTRDTAYVIRTVGDEHEPRTFVTWGAKAISGIGAHGVADTITSRSVILMMRRKLKGERCENMRHYDREAFAMVKRQFARWADDNGENFATMRPELDGLHNRTADNWEPLLAIADLAGGDWPKQARLAAHKLTHTEDDAQSINQELLGDIRAAFERTRTDKLHTSVLLEELCKDEESAWATYNRGRPVTARQLSKRVAEFGVKARQLKIDFANRNGYELADFKDAFARYLSNEPVPAQTSAARHEGDDYELF